MTPVVTNPPTAAGGDPSRQLQHLKAHLAFQGQDRYEQARIDWATTITRAQSRQHITRHLHRKINAKVPGFHGPGKLDTEEGQEALRTTARLVAQRRFHGGTGFHLIGWTLRYRMYRERSRRRGLSEEAFWEIADEERNSPRIQPKEKSFPEHIQQRLAFRREVCRLIRGQGSNPRHHKRAIMPETHLCPRTGSQVTREDADEDGNCPNCTLQLNQFSLVARAFDPGTPPALIAPGTWRRQPERLPQKSHKLAKAA